MKLTEADRDLIAQLKAERAKHLAIAKSLRDKDIAEKFGVHVHTIWRIPARDVCDMETVGI